MATKLRELPKPTYTDVHRGLIPSADNLELWDYDPRDGRLIGPLIEVAGMQILLQGIEVEVFGDGSMSPVHDMDGCALEILEAFEGDFECASKTVEVNGRRFVIFASPEPNFGNGK